MGETKVPESKDGQHRTILIVEDEAFLLYMARQVLEPQGYRILTAADGSEGIEVFCSHLQEVDLVVLDLSLPSADGETVLREIRRVRPEARVMLSSGDGLRLASALQTDERLRLVLPKPYTPSMLLKKIHSAF
jgi:two-component system, cell cycle sensor histidine kinase and response regulator CckA